MQAIPGTNGGRWWISPVVPAIANVVLGALWVFSAIGGWGQEAFCGSGANSCSDGFRTAVVISAVPAVVAVLVASAAFLPRNRRDPDRVDWLLTCAAMGWVIAGCALFIGGYFAK